MSSTTSTTSTSTTTTQALQIVGTSVPRVDSTIKVTGQKLFIQDIAAGFPDRLYAKVLRSNVAHANITAIDTSAAAAVPGVVAVITGQEYPKAVDVDYYMLSGPGAPSTPTGVIGRVMSFGEPVAAVAAVTPEIAEAACDLINVTYDVLPAIFDPATAAAPTAPTTCWTVGTDVPSTTSSPLTVTPRPPNVVAYQFYSKGNVAQAMASADYIIENTYSTPAMFHMAMEVFGAVVDPHSDGSVEAWMTTDSLFAQQNLIHTMLGIPLAQIRCYEAGSGGSFGCKHSVMADQVIAVALALKTGRPVEYIMTREESSLLNPRPDFVVVAKDGVMKDGTIVARQYTTYNCVGAHHLSDNVAQTLKAHTEYSNAIPNYFVEAYAVYTNTPMRQAFRGFGTPEQLWAIEQQMDLIAKKTGVDPVQLRLKYICQPGDLSIVGENSIQSSCGATPTLQQAAAAVGYGTTIAQPGAPWVRGVGVAAGNKYSPGIWGANVEVKVLPDGGIQVRSCVSDHGQGHNTVAAIIAAQQFQVPVSSISTVLMKDTATLGNCSASAGSTKTLQGGYSVILACQNAIQQLLALAAPKLNATAAQLSTANGYVYVTANPSTKIAISSLLSVGGEAEIVGTGSYAITGRSSDNSYVFLGAGAVVDVNTQTGEVRLVQLVNACDATPINVLAYNGQFESALSQTWGTSIMEEVVMDNLQPGLSYGRPVNTLLKFQKEPTSLDNGLCTVANYQTLIIPFPHPDGPYGAKGIGEALLSAAYPAVANAIANAIGGHIPNAPLTADKILAVLGTIKPQPSQNAVSYSSTPTTFGTQSTTTSTTTTSTTTTSKTTSGTPTE
ncbi:MAG: xanthine dehydrogenase family protein [Nitrososphaerales archaeon]|jgi:CO/xanthine dehydrogenase Mo-binding subunit